MGSSVHSNHTEDFQHLDHLTTFSLKMFLIKLYATEKVKVAFLPPLISYAETPVTTLKIMMRANMKICANHLAQDSHSIRKSITLPNLQPLTINVVAQHVWKSGALDENPEYLKTKTLDLKFLPPPTRPMNESECNSLNASTTSVGMEF